MQVRVGLVGYRMGNLMSLFNAFQAIQAGVFVADTPEQLAEATHLVLPGVGAFPMGMEHLTGLGFEPVLRRLVLDQGRPLLGVCLGMQLLASTGEEHRRCQGLGFIPGRATRLNGQGVRIPHIGWNDTVSCRDNPLLGPAGATDSFYYVHSYHLVPDEASHTIMTCEHGHPFAAAVARGNIFGVQFHPEKSHAGGLAVLKRFTEVGHAQTAADSVPVPAERPHRA